MKNLTIETPNLKGMMRELDELVEKTKDTVMQAAVAYCEEGVRNVQQSYLSTSRRGQVGDFIYSSISYRLIPSKKSGTIAWAGIGVYKIKSVEAKFGKTSHDFTAAQLAYWMEFGSTRYNSGARKPKTASWQNASTYVEAAYSVVPKPFVSNAEINGDEARSIAFADTFNRIVGK